MKKEDKAKWLRLCNKRSDYLRKIKEIDEELENLAK